MISQSEYKVLKDWPEDARRIFGMMTRDGNVLCYHLKDKLLFLADDNTRQSLVDKGIIKPVSKKNFLYYCYVKINPAFNEAILNYEKEDQKE